MVKIGAALVAALMVLTASASSFEIDRIEISGVTAVTSDKIRAALAIQPGDVPEHQKIEQTIENIRAIYKVHGYEDTEVRPRLLRTPSVVLRFDVIEGKPTRVAKVHFVLNGAQNSEFKRYWEGLLKGLRTAVGVDAGDRFDEEKIGAGKKAALSFLASKEFVGAVIDDIRLVPAKAAGIQSAARWIVLEIHVSLGDRVSFGFRGNTVFSFSQLLGFVEEQRTLGLGKDYVASIQTRIEEEYRALGYADVIVTPYTFEHSEEHERHVTYVISEGPRVRISDLNFDGNLVFSNEELRARFFDKAPSIVQSGYYSAKGVEKAADLLVEWMRSKGYLGAKLVAINLVKPKKSQESVKLVLYVYEGDRTMVQNIELSGMRVIKPSEAREILGIQESQPLNLFAFTEGIQTLKTLYRARGYLGIKILNEGSDSVVRYSQENRLADIHLDIDEGPLYRVSHVEIQGLNGTRENVVRRELPFHDGDILKEPDLVEADARLHRLGIFSDVAIHVADDPSRMGYKIVTVSVAEGTPGLIAGGLGFRNDLGPRIFGQVGYTNVGGRDQTISLSASVNRRLYLYRFGEYAAQLDYVWPWFADDPTTFHPSIAIAKTEYFSFDAETQTLGMSFDRKLLSHPNVSGSLQYNLENVNQFDADPTDTGQIVIGSLTPSVTLDLRDNPLAPTKGLFANYSFEYAAPGLLSQVNPYTVSYWRSMLRADYYLSLPLDSVFFFSFRTGFEKNLAFQVPGQLASGQIPLIKQFALGGPDSIRWLQEDQWNALTYYQNFIRGTLSYAVYRAQLDVPLFGDLKLGPFVDAGNLTVDRFELGALRYGTGFGLHYLTPMGPINFDLGFNLNPLPGESPSVFYFTIGVI